jgi:hypothetical protein
MSFDKWTPKTRRTLENRGKKDKEMKTYYGEQIL